MGTQWPIRIGNEADKEQTEVLSDGHLFLVCPPIRLHGTTATRFDSKTNVGSDRLKKVHYNYNQLFKLVPKSIIQDTSTLF